MIEKISKVNDVLEQLVLKLKNNYERLEKRAIQAQKSIEEDSTHTEYEALALLKKDAIMNKILYQYYSQKLRAVMDRAEISIVEMASINSNSEDFELEISSKDFTNINLEELCKGVRSNAVTEEILSSFEMFSGNDNPSRVAESKMMYEDNSCGNYDIKPTDDEYILSRVGSDCVSVNELISAGGDARPLTEDVMHAGGSAAPLTEELMRAGGGAIPVNERLKYAGGDANCIPEELMFAGGDAAPITEEMMHIGGSAAPLTKEVMSAGGDAAPISEELMHAGGSAAPITEELMFAGGDAVPIEEKMRYAGGDAAPKSAVTTLPKTKKSVSEKKGRKNKFSGAVR